jgi:acyl-CoA synthetase (AMP-forming)/AMP-acid ligase II
MYTSGSTGHPKGVMHSHESLLSSLRFTRDHLGVGGGDRVLIPLPLYHLFAFRVLLVHLLAGAAVILAPDVLAGLKRAPQTQPNALILVPAACALLTERFEAALARCAPWLRRVSVGSAALSPALLGRLDKLLPDTAIHIPYGMTEARIGFLEAVPGRPERRFAAVDPSLELHAVDEQGAPVERGVGEIVVRGSGLMLGYWHARDEENARMRREGFRTRDLMEITATGERYLLGRIDDVISVGGEKVFPLEVESVLLACPQIRDARVSGAEDPPEERFDREALLAHCRARLEPYKIPQIIETAPEIARDSMGKVTSIARSRAGRPAWDE